MFSPCQLSLLITDKIKPKVVLFRISPEQAYAPPNGNIPCWQPGGDAIMFREGCLLLFPGPQCNCFQLINLLAYPLSLLSHFITLFWNAPGCLSWHFHSLTAFIAIINSPHRKLPALSPGYNLGMREERDDSMPLSVPTVWAESPVMSENHECSYVHKFGLLWTPLTCQMTDLNLWTKCIYHSGWTVLVLPCWLKFGAGTEMISRSVLSTFGHSFGKACQDREVLELVDKMFLESGKRKKICFCTLCHQV